MPRYDDRTAKGWPLPHRFNKLWDDADRLRETLNAIDANVTEIEGTLQNVTDVNDFLSTRMEVIVGEATEDTEILDARIDAEGKVHQNLGQNVRHIHSGLLGVIENIKYGVQEFQGLLHQFSAVAEAQIQDEVNAVEAHERRKAEIQQEALVRLGQDDGLQTQINEASEAVMRMVLTLNEINTRLKARATSEENARISGDDALQREINALADSFLRSTLTLHDAIESRREALKREIQARIAEDAQLQEQINVNAEAIRQETEKRIHDDVFLEGCIREVAIEADTLKHEADQETQARAKADEGLARQANANAEAAMHMSITVQDLNARRKADLIREEHERIAHDADLQGQIDETAEASLENALNIHQEAEERRKVHEALNAEILQRTDHDSQQDAEILTQQQELSQERQIRTEQDNGLQRQADSSAEAIIQAAVNLDDANARRKADLTREEEARIAGDSDLQGQIDRTAQASLENALGIHQEAEQRRKSDARIEALKDETGRRIEIDEYHQQQIDSAVLAILQNILALSEGLARQRTALATERQARVDDDDSLQEQADTNSAAIMQTELNIHQEAEERRKLLARLYEEKLDIERQIQREIQLVRDEIGELYEVPLPGLQDELSELQKQLDSNAEADIRTLLNVHEALVRSREALKREAQSRIDEDAGLEQQIHTNSAANISNALNLHDAILRRIAALKQEAQSRIDEDASIREQVNVNAQSILQITLNHEAGLSRQREALYQETQARIDDYSGLQKQIDTNANTSLLNALNLHQEAEQRRQSDTRIKALTDESNRQIEIDDYHQQQIDDAVLAILQNSLTLSEGLASQRTAIKQETQARAEQDCGILAQVKALAVALAQSTINSAVSDEKRRQEDLQERQSRYKEDAGILAQVNALAEANMWMLVREDETKRKLSEVIQQVEESPSRPASDDEFDEMLDELYKQ